jgi:hypothetical protein
MNRRRSSDLPSDLSRLTLNASEATAKVEVPETLSLSSAIAVILMAAGGSKDRVGAEADSSRERLLKEAVRVGM